MFTQHLVQLQHLLTIYNSFCTTFIDINLYYLLVQELFYKIVLQQESFTTNELVTRFSYYNN